MGRDILLAFLYTVCQAIHESISYNDLNENIQIKCWLMLDPFICWSESLTGTIANMRLMESMIIGFIGKFTFITSYPSYYTKASLDSAIEIQLPWPPTHFKPTINVAFGPARKIKDQPLRSINGILRTIYPCFKAYLHGLYNQAINQIYFITNHK